MNEILEMIEAKLKQQKNEIYLRDIQIAKLREDLAKATAEIEELKGAKK